ncbi:hypothetical protein ACH5RR_024414 [Cinchona calisaya]|uniref:Uncharacterized protein n=1 Tax=Cinchona calisaya TaxID=153742 RepID=A0ABD2Z0S3_9GENT
MDSKGKEISFHFSDDDEFGDDNFSSNSESFEREVIDEDEFDENNFSNNSEGSEERIDNDDIYNENIPDGVSYECMFWARI